MSIPRGVAAGGRKGWFAGAALAGVIALGGLWVGTAWAGPEPASATSATGPDNAMNEMCPVMTDELTDPDIWVDYNGRRIWFCCQKCKRQFERDPERYLVNLASAPAEAEPAHASDAFMDAASDLLIDEPAGDVADAKPKDTNAAPAPDKADTDHDADHDADHDEDKKSAGGEPKLLEWLGNFHPAAVNFPVGLLVAGALAELLLMVTKRPSYAPAARFCVWFGGLGAIVGATLGWFFGGFEVLQDDWMLAVHRWLGTLTALTGLAALVFSEAHQRRPEAPSRRHRYRAALFMAATLVLITGFFGGAMVWGLKHYAW